MVQLSLLIVLLGLISSSVVAINEDHIDKIDKALAITKATVDSIYKEWQVDKYPNFLKSCFMQKMSWEIMRFKFQKKVIDALKLASGSPKPTFVISFTGSSVTAGHDNHFNTSAPVVTGTYMKDSFAPLGIDLVTRNVALGNNPCTPYDVCVKYFAGTDADIVHWEQTYFCSNNRAIVEQFIRQAMAMPSKPIVVFSDSHSGKWDAKGCAGKAEHVINAQEKAVLAANPVHLVSELNKDTLRNRWDVLTEHVHQYHGAALQTFQHLDHEPYACQGPYIPEWNKGAASWHPSVIAHRMRAAHHAYFWLLSFAEALAELKATLSHRVLDAVEKDVQHHLDKLITPMGPARHPSAFPDQAQCFTDYEPRPVREASLKAKVLSGLEVEAAAGVEARAGWKHMIYEDIVDHNLVLRSQQMMYRDFKYLIHGDKAAGPLSLTLELTKSSPLFVCQTPGIWGSLPKGFDHLWLGHVEAYVTYNVPDTERVAGFTFKKGAASKLDITYDKANELCVTLSASGTDSKLLAPGKHVLTLHATSATRVIVAWVITA